MRWIYLAAARCRKGPLSNQVTDGRGDADGAREVGCAWAMASGEPRMKGPVRIALVGMGWWGRKILDVLQAAPVDIRVVRAVEPNIETVKAVCAQRGVPLSGDYSDALDD